MFHSLSSITALHQATVDKGFAALDLFARAVLRRDAGGYELRCPREYEAQTVERLFAWTMTADFNEVLCLGATLNRPTSWCRRILGQGPSIGTALLNMAPHIVCSSCLGTASVRQLIFFLVR